MEFHNHVLDNGLELVAECNPKAYSAGLAFFVKTGSRDETDALSGVSHFLEHMVFKGTDNRSAEDVNRELDEVSSYSNAYTSWEKTVYYAAFLPEQLERVTELLSDIMRPALREDDFAMEKQVILEEIAKYEDQPPFGADDKCMAAHFQTHPLSRNILGTTASIQQLSAEQMRGYFQQRYSPSNITIAAAGRVDFQDLVGLAQQYCGAWKRYDVQRDTTRAGPARGFHLLSKTVAAQQYVVQISNGPAAEDEDRYASRLLAMIFGDDGGSRMYWDLIETGRAEYAVMAPYEFQGTGIAMTSLGCSPRDTQQNLARLWQLQQEIEQHGVSADELDRAKSKMCAHIVLQSERPANRMFAVGGNWLQRHEYQTVRQSIEAYQRVTPADIAAVLEKYPLTRNTTFTVGPLDKLTPPWPLDD